MGAYERGRLDKSKRALNLSAKALFLGRHPPTLNRATLGKMTFCMSNATASPTPHAFASRVTTSHRGIWSPSGAPRGRAPHRLLRAVSSSDVVKVASEAPAVRSVLGTMTFGWKVGRGRGGEGGPWRPFRGERVPCRPPACPRTLSCGGIKYAICFSDRKRSRLANEWAHDHGCYQTKPEGPTKTVRASLHRQLCSFAFGKSSSTVYHKLYSFNPEP